MFVFNVFTIYTSKLPNKSMYKVKHFFVIFPRKPDLTMAMFSAQSLIMLTSYW